MVDDMTETFFVNHTSMIIPNYQLGDCEKLEGLLSVWDGVTFSFKPIGYHYEDNTLYIPRALDVNYVGKLLNRRPVINYESDKRETTSIRLTVPPKNDLQNKSISFLLGLRTFSHTAKKSQLALTLSTGSGKTYCMTACICQMKTKAMIMTHNDNIKLQWIESFASFTDIHPSEIMNLEGSKSIKKVLKEKNRKYKVYIANRQTINSYAKRNGWNAVRELFKELGIGVKVYDEAHIEFATIMKIDFFTNVYKTFYLTANFERSDPGENRLFKLAFKNIEKYGEESKEILKKNIIYVPVLFDSNPSYVDKTSMKGRYGLDRNKYSIYLTENSYYQHVLKTMFEKFSKLFEDINGKLMFFSTSIAATEAVKKIIETAYDVNVQLYNSTLTDEEKDIALESTFISSTPKSLGTGTDIPNLRVVINSEPYKSAVTANQNSGRLRYHNDEKFSFYVELIDMGFDECKRLYKARKKTLEDKCAKVVEINMQEE